MTIFSSPSPSPASPSTLLLPLPQLSPRNKILGDGFVMWRNRANSRWAPPPCSSSSASSSIDQSLPLSTTNTSGGILINKHPSSSYHHHSSPSLARSNTTTTTTTAPSPHHHLLNKSDRLRILNSKKSCTHSLLAAYDDQDNHLQAITESASSKKPSDHSVISNLTRSFNNAHVEPLTLLGSSSFLNQQVPCSSSSSNSTTTTTTTIASTSSSSSTSTSTSNKINIHLSSLNTTTNHHHHNNNNTATTTCIIKPSISSLNHPNWLSSDTSNSSSSQPSLPHLAHHPPFSDKISPPSLIPTSRLSSSHLHPLPSSTPPNSSVYHHHSDQTCPSSPLQSSSRLNQSILIQNSLDPSLPTFLNHSPDLLSYHNPLLPIPPVINRHVTQTPHPDNNSSTSSNPPCSPLQQPTRNRSFSRGSLSHPVMGKILIAEERTSSAFKSVKTTTQRFIRSLTPTQSSSPASRAFHNSRVSDDFPRVSSTLKDIDLFNSSSQPPPQSTIDLYQDPESFITSTTITISDKTSKPLTPPSNKPTHSRWASGSHKFLMSLKKKPSQLPHNPLEPSQPPSSSSLSISELKKPFTLLSSYGRRTSLNDTACNSPAKIGQEPDALSCLNAAATQSFQPHPRRKSTIQLQPITDFTTTATPEKVSLPTGLSNPPRREGFSLRRNREPSRVGADTTTWPRNNDSSCLQQASLPALVNSRLLSRPKSPPPPPAVKPLKSAFNLINRQDRHKSSRHSKSMTNLNHIWVDITANNSVPKPQATITPSQAPSERSQLHHRSYSQCLSTQAPPVTLLSSSSSSAMPSPDLRHQLRSCSKFQPHLGHLATYPSTLPFTPSTSYPSHLLTQSYSPAHYHSTDPLLRSTQSGHVPEETSGRYSPTKLALTRLDEIIRGASTPSSTPVMSSLPVPAPYVPESPPGPYNLSPRSSAFAARSLIAAGTSNPHSHPLASPPRLGTNALSPPMRRHPPNHHGSAPLVAQGLRLKPETSPDGPFDDGVSPHPAPAPKKILIKPSAWEHISISASEHKHRRDLLEQRLGRRNSLEDVAVVPRDPGETTIHIGGPSSPLFSANRIPPDEQWQATIGKYRRPRSNLLEGNAASPTEPDEDESMFYKTSPTSLRSSPRFAISPPGPEYKTSDGSLISSATNTSISEPSTSEHGIIGVELMSNVVKTAVEVADDSQHDCCSIPTLLS